MQIGRTETELARRETSPVNDRRRDTLLRLPKVRERTGLSTTSIYRKMATGEFPASVRLSINMIGWYESDVDRWIADPLGWRAAA